MKETSEFGEFSKASAQPNKHIFMNTLIQSISSVDAAVEGGMNDFLVSSGSNQELTPITKSQFVKSIALERQNLNAKSNLADGLIFEFGNNITIEQLSVLDKFRYTNRSQIEICDEFLSNFAIRGVESLNRTRCLEFYTSFIKIFTEQAWWYKKLIKIVGTLVKNSDAVTRENK